MRAFFTGHRNLPLLYLDWKKGIENLIKIAYNEGVNHYYCGMALGSDQLFARTLIDFQLPFTAVIPCQNQDIKWTRKQKQNYRDLLRLSTRKITLYPEYSPGVFHARNTYMIKHSDICLAVYDGRKSGGTYQTFKLAIRKADHFVRACNLTVFRFNPLTNKITVIKPVYEQLNLL